MCSNRVLYISEAKTAAELQSLESRWARTEDLLAQNLILEQEVEDLRPQIEATRKILARYPALLAQLEKRLEAAQRDIEMYSSEELKSLQQARGRLEATTSGVVAEIQHQPGDVPVIVICHSRFPPAEQEICLLWMFNFAFSVAVPG